MSKLCGLIPAAGKGLRAYPYTKIVPKCLLDINDKPTLERNIEIMRDKLGIKDIYIVVGYMGEAIKNFCLNGDRFGVHIKYIQNDKLDKGLAYSILLAKKHIKDHFAVILSDEFYLNTNHEGLLDSHYKDSMATCAIMHVDDTEIIRKNYTVKLENARVTQLEEKPKNIASDILGCGTFIFSPVIFSKIEEEFSRSRGRHVDFLTAIGSLVNEGEKINAFTLKGDYVNVNDRDSLNLAKYYDRNVDFNRKTISLVIYSEGDEEDIQLTINRYKSLNRINDISVVLPKKNSIERMVTTSGAKATICPEKCVLYGEKIKYGLENAPGDILVVTEAAYSFPARDMEKLLVYLPESYMVIGTRTTRQLIEQGSNMRGIVRLAHVFLAKLVELLWWEFEGRFTDVGCTFRALWRSTFLSIKKDLTAKGPEFFTEMIIEVLRRRERIIEIPVNYFNRSHSIYRKYQNIGTFLKILYLIIKKRCKSIIRKN